MISNKENEILLTHYQKFRQIIEDFTIMSDTFMRNVLKKKECAEYVIQVIMGQKDLKVISVIVQQDNKNMQGRSVTLDCVAQDAEGRRFDVEVQQKSNGASPKRSRYHSSILDSNTLNPSEDFDQLPESHVIFITEEDVLGHGLAIYHITRTIAETKEHFGDQSHIIYVNSQIQDDTELGRLMHDFHCRNAEEMYSKILADRVRELKETQEGVDSMCIEMEKLYNEGKEEGREEGKREVAYNLADRGMSAEDIAQVVQVDIRLVNEWLSGYSSTEKESLCQVF